MAFSSAAFIMAGDTGALAIGGAPTILCRGGTGEGVEEVESDESFELLFESGRISPLIVVVVVVVEVEVALCEPLQGEIIPSTVGELFVFFEGEDGLRF